MDDATTDNRASTSILRCNRCLTIAGIIRHCEGAVGYCDDLPLRDDDRTAKVMGVIARCRSGRLGGRQWECDVANGQAG
ncbi:MAG: hypothetical protein AAF958_08805 [Planctomycetota bacterium]